MEKYSNTSNNLVQFDSNENYSGYNSIKLYNAGGLSSYNWIGNDRGTASTSPTPTTLIENGYPIEAGKTYELSFYCKTDIVGIVSNQVQNTIRTYKSDGTLKINSGARYVQHSNI